MTLLRTHLITMLDDLRTRSVKFRSLTEAIDTEAETPTGRAMWQMIGVLAELERSLISDHPTPEWRRRNAEA